MMSKKEVIGIGLAVVLTASYLGVHFYASNVAEKRVNKAIAKLAKFTDVDDEKVSVDLLGMNVRISKRKWQVKRASSAKKQWLQLSNLSITLNVFPFRYHQQSHNRLDELCVPMIRMMSFNC